MDRGSKSKDKQCPVLSLLLFQGFLFFNVMAAAAAADTAKCLCLCLGDQNMLEKKSVCRREEVEEDVAWLSLKS